MNFAAVKHVRSERDLPSLLRMLQVNVLGSHLVARTFAASSPARPASSWCPPTRPRTLPTSWAPANGPWSSPPRWPSPRITSARFANVAFSSGSLLESWLRRVTKANHWPSRPTPGATSSPRKSPANCAHWPLSPLQAPSSCRRSPRTAWCFRRRPGDRPGRSWPTPVRGRIRRRGPATPRPRSDGSQWPIVGHAPRHRQARSRPRSSPAPRSPPQTWTPVLHRTAHRPGERGRWPNSSSASTTG